MSEINHTHEHDDHNHETKERPAHYPETIQKDNRYWLSLDQWKNDPEFQKLAEKEFMSSPLQNSDGEDGWARREFLKLMGASLAMATAGCIRRPMQKIVPYAKQPEEVTLGVANLYSSTWFDGSEALGLLIKSKEGRPIKIEGNPTHPANKGALSVRSQANILRLYDPERFQGPKRNLLNKEKTNRDTINISWDDLDTKVVEALNKGGVAMLTGAIASPSTRQLFADFSSAFNANHVTWEAFAHEEIRQGAEASYGTSVVPEYQFDKAQMIVSIDADFLGTWISPVKFTRQFSQGRKNIEKMSRLVSFNSNYSLTGANSDIRIRIKPSQQLDVVMGLIHEIVVKKSHSSFAGNATVKAASESFANVAQEIGMDAKLFSQIADDLIANRGKGLVVAGGLATLTAQAVQLQIAVNFLNSVLGNEGETVVSQAASSVLKASYSELVSLVADMNAKKVKSLIIHGVNPVYALPSSLGFVEALKNVETVIYTGDRNDETGKLAEFIACDNHSLENWGDSETSKGVFAIQQPAIRPMYDTRSIQLSMITWAYQAEKGAKRLTEPESYYDYLRTYWKENIFAKAGSGLSFEDFWVKAMQDGVVITDKVSGSARSFRTDALSQIKKQTQSGFELVLYPTVALGDGSMANVSWLQELPDPVTKICWDNYVSMSLATAEKHGIKDGNIIVLKVGEKTLEVPAHIQPGQHDEVLALAVGYGRTAAGKVGNNIGVNAFELAQVSAKATVFAGMTASFEKTSKKYSLANTQGHHSMEGRQIVVEATLEDYLKNKSANIHKHKVFSIWTSHKYDGHKWGMAVDLNSCTGCSACMTACQSENNVTVVGKKYILEGREMSWIRIDRYYTGNPADAEVVFQPLMCQHCDNAPCETVCPVLATVHSNEGLNEMVYNRCVGTRYCSNNCPYKVRRFNWFNYAKLIEKPMHMALNPDVTVRPRGVMEKCTFCVQRIKEGKNKAKTEGRKLKDGDIKTACQTSCPTDAIVFGDLNDSESQVSQMFKQEPRSYALLEEWNAAPSVRYLSKIRNNGKVTDHSAKGGH